MNRCKVWPMHDNIQDGDRAFGRFMVGPREVDIDDPYWRARLADASVSLTDPTPVSVSRPATIAEEK